MIYRFIFVSDEVDDFYREIQIDSEASFLDFHNAILESVGYPDDQMTSFFICEDNWEKREEITREEMNTSSDVDSWVMESTRISELVEDEKQRLIYIFDTPEICHSNVSNSRKPFELAFIAGRSLKIIPMISSTIMVFVSFSIIHLSIIKDNLASKRTPTVIFILGFNVCDLTSV